MLLTEENLSIWIRTITSATVSTTNLIWTDWDRTRVFSARGRQLTACDTARDGQVSCNQAGQSINMQLLHDERQSVHGHSVTNRLMFRETTAVAHSATSWKVAVSIPDCTRSLGFIPPLTEMSIREHFLRRGVNSAGA